MGMDARGGLFALADAESHVAVDPECNVHECDEAEDGPPSQCVLFEGALCEFVDSLVGSAVGSRGGGLHFEVLRCFDVFGK
jgi:hypothetical protein